MNDGRFLFQWEFKAVNTVETVLGDFVRLSGSLVFFQEPWHFGDSYRIEIVV